MSKLVWDQIGERYYETGVEKGVLYPVENGTYQAGVVVPRQSQQASSLDSRNGRHSVFHM